MDVRSARLFYLLQLVKMSRGLRLRAVALMSILLGCCYVSTGAYAAGLNFTKPVTGSVLKDKVIVTVNVPSVSNALAQKINLKIDDQFYRSQSYSRSKSSYTFEIDTRAFKNGSHKLTAISINNGQIVSRDDRWYSMANTPLILSNPQPDTVLSGSYTATGIVRVNADKVNIKFDNNNSLVYSYPLTKDKRNAQSFTKRIDTTRLSDGPHTMTVRAVTNGGRDLKTINLPINVQNGSDDPINFDATVIPIPSSGAYAGVYTNDTTLNNPFLWTTRLQAILNFEQLVYGNNGKKFAIDRQFYRWNNLLNNQGALNPYIKATSLAGRIPVISLNTINKDGSEVVCPDGSNKKIWACIADGNMDAKLQEMAKQIRISGVEKMGFSFVIEPEDEIRCHNERRQNPGAQCVPINRSIDMGSKENYIGAWRRLVTVFDNAGVNNVDFIWVLQGTTFDPNRRQPGFEAPLDMYPGNDVIDWVAADIYNTAFTKNSWKSMAELTIAFVKWAEINSPNKPLMLPEFGVAEDPDGVDKNRRANWLREAAAWLKKQERIKGVAYFNRDERFSTDATFRDWRIGTVHGTEQFPLFNFKKSALPISVNGFRDFMRDEHFLDSEEPVQ